MRVRRVLVGALVGVCLVGTPGVASAEPPGIPGLDQAQTLLGELTVAPEGSMDGYSRDNFPHWSTVTGECDTRETVLQRDGTDVQMDESCSATAGSWVSPYDGATWSDASDVDIDHIVPLAEAWRSGSAEWTEDQREAFANDLEGPQLIAVTDNVNQTKGDKSPDQWKPPAAGYHCVYASMWIATKHTYELTITDPEAQALRDMLGTC